MNYQLGDYVHVEFSGKVVKTELLRSGKILITVQAGDDVFDSILVLANHVEPLGAKEVRINTGD